MSPGLDHLVGETVLIHTDENPDAPILTTVQAVGPVRILTAYGTYVPVSAIRLVEKVSFKRLAPEPEFDDVLDVLYERPADAPVSTEPVLHHAITRDAASRVH